MNYAQLTAAIQGYTENSDVDFVSAIPTFIQQAEQRIYNTVQIANLRKNVTGTLTAGNKYLSAPEDFLSVYSIAVIGSDGSYEFMINKDVNFIRQAYPSPQSLGKPRYYAIFGPTTTNDAQPVITNELSFIVGPTPDISYAVELHYYYYPVSITVAPSGQTWLGDNFDSVLLYGSLIEAYTWMKGDQDIMQLYDAKYKEAMLLLKNLGDGKQRGDAYLDGQVRARVQ